MSDYPEFADPQVRPRYTGLPTFMRAPYTENLSGIDLGLAGIPFDGGVTNRTGARHGPREIRNQSSLMRKINQASGLSPFEACRVADIGDAWVEKPFELEGALGEIAAFFEKVHAAGGTVFHDVTARKWAEKARDAGVDGLICVNDRAGGHAGTLSPEALIDECGDLGLPLVAAGGVGDPEGYVRLLNLGYGAVQMGTRFIATEECEVHPDYWEAIIDAGEEDIVLTERLSGVPVAVINTPLVQRVGTKAGPIARRLLKGRRTKHWMRTFYACALSAS